MQHDSNLIHYPPSHRPIYAATFGKDRCRVYFLRLCEKKLTECDISITLKTQFGYNIGLTFNGKAGQFASELSRFSQKFFGRVEM